MPVLELLALASVATAAVKSSKKKDKPSYSNSHTTSARSRDEIPVWRLISEKCRDYSDSSSDRRLTEVARRHPAFSSIRTQFEEEWRHPTGMPSIYKIYRITCSAQYIERFESYKAQIERRTGYSDANCIRSWHGTVRGCRVGDRDDGTALCPPSRCSLCSIIEDSYGASSESSGERRHAWGRFGTGIYTTCTSSKAFDSAKEKGGSDYTALLLNEVTMGEPYYSERNLDDLKKPPSGYDSVVGVPGHKLNYDEVVVYTKEAIRPAYLVLLRN